MPSNASEIDLTFEPHFLLTSKSPRLYSQMQLLRQDKYDSRTVKKNVNNTNRLKCLCVIRNSDFSFCSIAFTICDLQPNNIIFGIIRNVFIRKISPNSLMKLILENYIVLNSELRQLLTYLLIFMVFWLGFLIASFRRSAFFRQNLLSINFVFIGNKCEFHS